MKNILLVILILSPSFLYSQNEKTLDECIHIAWSENLDLQSSELRIQTTRLAYIASVGNFLPRLNLSADAGRNYGRSINPNTNEYTTDTFDEGSIGLDMTLSLFEGFSRINRVNFEKLNRKRSEWELKAFQNTIAYQVADAYYKLLLEQKMLELTIEQGKLSKRYMKQTEVFVELGLKSKSDLQEIKARYQGDTYRHQSRNNSCQLLLLQLKQLLNMTSKDTLIIQDSIDYENIPPYLIPNADALYAQSVELMPSLQIMNVRQHAAKKERAMASALFSPSIYTRFSMNTRFLDHFSTTQFDNNLGKYVGIGISLPILSGLERLTTLRKHKLNIDILQNDKELTEQQLYTEVEHTILSLRAGQEEQQQVLQQLHADRQVLKESERKWEEGLISLFQLMEARNRFVSAEAELVRVRLQIEMTMRMEKYYRTGSFVNK